MEGSRQLILNSLAGKTLDRVPLFDLLANDAILCHFNNGKPVEIGDDRSGARAVAQAMDATRMFGYSPQAERKEIQPDGQVREYHRWTTWRPHRICSVDEYRDWRRGEQAELRKLMEKPLCVGEDAGYRRHLQLLDWFGDDFVFLLGPPHTGLMGLHMSVGLESFSYFLTDCEDVILDQMELNTEYGCRWIEALPANAPFDVAIIGDDMAFKTGPMFSPGWLKREYFPRQARVIAALHKRGLKVMFHSDGNLNMVMDDLVAMGIDLLNPIEVAAGMDLADLHRRYPKLIFAGGIDVTELLPFGTPQQVKDAVNKAIDDTDGQIWVGSSTEVHNSVPLENFLVMREAVMFAGAC